MNDNIINNTDTDDSNQQLTSEVLRLNNGCHEIPAALAHYPVIHEQPIQWGEMDAFNHLNNVVYYRYAESARIGYLQALGMFDGSMVMMLAHSSCQYLLPVAYPDTLLLGVRCQRLGTTSMVIEYSYYSCDQQTVVATAEAVIVRLDSAGKEKLPWSTEERMRLFELEKKVGHTPES
ncbi:acyl-CoA thioesterase [Psychrobacter jeotgali]|uniref:acyl-CoA thioesterase n=1 Tax=Psychrobacter jeotgali TaxID=179010 RepID=UPI001919945A|nr:acyl-CoA thioesterase [Psychrobacter jeotgali]